VRISVACLVLSDVVVGKYRDISRRYYNWKDTEKIILETAQKRLQNIEAFEFLTLCRRNPF